MIMQNKVVFLEGNSSLYASFYIFRIDLFRGLISYLAEYLFEYENVMSSNGTRG